MGRRRRHHGTVDNPWRLAGSGAGSASENAVTSGGSSMASRLEQLNRIAVGIFNLNLFAAGADLHFISKTQTRLFQLSNACRQILHLKEHTVPSAGLLMTAILDRSGPRCPGTAQD